MIISAVLLKTLFAYTTDLVLAQTATVSHEESLRTPPRRWQLPPLGGVVGHIISARSRSLRAVGESPMLDEVQRAPYRSSSPPIGSGHAGVLEFSALRDALQHSQRRLEHGLAALSAEDLRQPSGFRDNTVGESLAYFLICL